MRDRRQPNKAATITAVATRLLRVSFEKHVSGGKFCLGDCEERSVRSFTDCLRKLCSLTLFQLHQTMGKGANKTGLAYTPYDDHALKGATRPSTVPADRKICSVRAGSDDRLFGFIDDHVFFVLWFDPNHDIVPQP